MTRNRRLLPPPTSFSSLALIVASVTSGLSAYAFTVIGVRAFGPDSFAPIAVVWSVWAVTVAGISSPLQHWIIQAVSGTGSDDPVRRRRGSLLAFALIGSLLLGASMGVWRESIFSSSAWIFPVATGSAVATAALTGYVRGVLGSRHRFAALSATLSADAILRLLLAVLIVAVGLNAQTLAIAVPAASLVSLLWSSTFRLSSSPRASTASRSTSSGLGKLAGAFLTLHLLLNAPPVVASAIGADPALVSSLFAAFALFRAPFLMMSVLSTKVSHRLASLAATGRSETLDQFRRMVGASTIGVMVLAGVLGGAPSIWALRFVYGDQVVLSVTEGRVIVAGSVAAVGVLLMVLLLSARAAPATAFVPLPAGVIAGAVWLVLASTIDPGLRVASGFLAGVVVTLIGLSWTDSRATTQRRAGPAPFVPGDGTVGA